MPCTSTTFLNIDPIPTRVRKDRSTFIKIAIALFDALQEAWSMRCAIRKRFPFDYE
jgi:hypothetical protein